MEFDFEVGDEVEWSEFTVGDGSPIEAGRGTVISVLKDDTDGMNYAVEVENGDVWYPYNHLITRVGGGKDKDKDKVIRERNLMPVKSLNGLDLGKVVRIPDTRGLVVQGTLLKVTHSPTQTVVLFEESSTTYYAENERDFEYVNE